MHPNTKVTTMTLGGCGSDEINGWRCGADEINGDVECGIKVRGKWVVGCGCRAVGFEK